MSAALGTQTGAEREAAKKEKETQALKDAADAKRVDAQWAEMQSTLGEVELSAQAGGSINAVFGPGHAKALEELRRAQVGLAKAWARSEVDDPESPTKLVKAEGEGKAKRDLGGNADLLSKERSEKLGGVSAAAVGADQRVGGNMAGVGKTGGNGKTALEEETENDIRLARKRREANDRYFSRVNKGVLDVVSRLEEVAKAMKSVEMESREIWGEEEEMEEG